MNEEFEIPVDYNGKELTFKGLLLNFGYTHKIQVDVNGIDVIFEPDEERNYRIVVDPDHLEGKKKLDVNLLQAILATLESAAR